MEILNSDLDLEAFWQRLSSAGDSVLMLDYDGTLAPFTENRMEAVPYTWVPGVLEMLLEAGGTRIVLISGRRVEEVAELLGLQDRLEIWGAHGLERMFPGGKRERHREPEGVARAFGVVEEWAGHMGMGERLERKPGCAALHFRGLDPEARARLESSGERLFNRMTEDEPRLSVHPFDGGIELRESACNKGDAVATILDECHAAPPSAFLGDDLTDEDGFRAIKGRGLGVLVRKRLRRTCADIWLAPPEELRWFLATWLRCRKGK